MFLKIYDRLLRYYLLFPQHHGKDFGRLRVEIPNLERALKSAIVSEQTILIPDFWNRVKDPLWDHGYWSTFVDWGGNALLAFHDLGAKEPEAWLLSELGWFWMEQGEFHVAKDLFERADPAVGGGRHWRADRPATG